MTKLTYRGIKYQSILQLESKEKLLTPPMLSFFTWRGISYSKHRNHKLELSRDD